MITSAPWRLRRQRDIVRGLAENDGFGAVLFVNLRDVPKPARHGRHVHGRVAAADHQHAARANLEAALVEGFKERDAADAVGGFLGAVHRERASGLRAASEKHRVVIFPQLVERHVHADFHAGADLDAHVDNAFNLAIEHVARRAVAGDAVAHHPAQFGARLEDGGGMAFTAQEIGAGEPGGTAADDGHALAGGRSGRGQLEAMLKRIVADIVLDGIDADVVFDLVAVAAVLARSRADAPHDGRERIGLHHALERIFLPRHAHGRLFQTAHDVEPAANVVPGGAATLAGRRAVNVGRAFVRCAGSENQVAQFWLLDVAILVAAERKRCFHYDSFLPAYSYRCNGCGGSRRLPAPAWSVLPVETPTARIPEKGASPRQPFRSNIELWDAMKLYFLPRSNSFGARKSQIR